MLTPDEQTAWTAYVDEMTAKGLAVDLSPLLGTLRTLDDTANGRVLAEALGLDTMPLEDLAKRLTLQTRAIIQTGRVPE
jgi:hypothetical protein